MRSSGYPPEFKSSALTGALKTWRLCMLLSFGQTPGLSGRIFIQESNYVSNIELATKCLYYRYSHTNRWRLKSHLTDLVCQCNNKLFQLANARSWPHPSSNLLFYGIPVYFKTFVPLASCTIWLNFESIEHFSIKLRTRYYVSLAFNGTLFHHSLYAVFCTQ